MKWYGSSSSSPRARMPQSPAACSPTGCNMTDGLPARVDRRRPHAARAAMPVPRLDPESALLFVINAAAGALDVDAKRAVIESTLAARGRKGELLICAPAELARVATEAAAAALARDFGGDRGRRRRQPRHGGTGRARGGLPDGSHPLTGPSTTPRARTASPRSPRPRCGNVLDAHPRDRCRLGCHQRPASSWSMPAWASIPSCCRIARPTRPASAAAAGWPSSPAARRCCARSAGCACTSRWAPRVRDVQTLTLFVGNNRLQLQQLGAEPADTVAGTPGDGSLAALMLRPIGTLSMLGLMLARSDGPAGRSRRRGKLRVHRTWW